MKKIFSITLAVIMVLMAFPFVASAAEVPKASGAQSMSATDAQITTNVCSIWYYDDNGVWTKHADYANLDAASDGLRDLYVGPLADTTLVDGDDEDTNLNNELYEAAGSPVIKLNGNFQGDYVRPNWCTDKNVSQWVGYDKNKVVTIVIDGAKNENENYTITYGTSSAAFNTNTFNHLAYYNLTIKNTNMIINSGANTIDGTFCWAGNSGMADPGESFTIFENCSIIQTASSTGGSGTLFKMNGKAKFNSAVSADPYLYDKYNLILKDTTIEAGTGLGHQAHWGVDANIELHNSTMALTCKGGDNGNNNDALLKFYEAGVGRVYLDGTSKLIGRRTASGETIALIRVLSSQKAAVTVELEEGAELSMQNTASLTRKTYIAAGNGALTTITDNGAIYSASATDVKGGVDLPVSMKGKTWLAGAGYEVTPDNTTDAARLIYTDADATHGVALTSTGTAPITLKKNSATVTATADMTDLNAVFDYVYAQADSADYTIYLNGGVTTSEYFNPESYDSTNVKTIRIDGQGNNLRSYNTTATFYGIGLYNLELSNLTISYGANQASSLDWSPRKTPSDSYGNYIATGSNPVVDTQAVFTNVVSRPAAGVTAGNFKLKGGNSGAQNLGTYGIKLVDSEFTSTLADTMFMMNDKGNLDLDLIGTTINYIGGAGNNDGNNHIFALNGAAVDINVDGNSVLKSASTSTRVTSGIFNNGTNYAVNVTLAEGAELYLTGNDYKTSAKFFMNEKATTKIVDNGAKWIIGKELLDNGALVTLPTSMFKDAAEDHVWYVDGEAVSNPYIDVTATADVILTHAVPVDPAEGKVAYIELGGEKTYYATLQSAINAVGALYDAVTTENLTDDALWQAAGSPVINLYEDITITSEHYLPYGTYDANRVRTLVIKGAKTDGTNPLITSINGGAAFAYNAYYNLTLEDIDLTCTQGFAIFWRGYNGNNSVKSTTNMINCNITAPGTSGEGLVFKVTGNQNQTKTENYIINMENTHVEAKAGVNAVFLFHHGCAGTLNIDGDSSIHHVMNRNSDGGDTMFMLGSNRKFTINIADGANLSADLQAGGTAAAHYKSYAMFRIEGTDTYASADGIKNDINIGNNVEMSITGNGNFNMPAYFIQNNLTPTATAKKTILTIGENVTMSVDANVAADGFGGYVGRACDDGDILGSYINGDTTKLYNSVIPAGVINEAVTNITPVFYTITADDFDMQDGAALRTVSGENGIRFTSVYTQALLDKLTGAKVTFGTLIAPTAVWGEDALTLENAATLNEAVAGQVLNLVSTKPQADGTSFKVNAAVIMEPSDYENVTYEDIYNLELAARGYMTITYADGTTATHYTAHDDNNVRSMYDVADALRADRETNNVIDNILNVCEPAAQ